jgi:tetratricopeptide (TPR) repeat protein
VVPHPLLGPVLRHALADRPELLASHRAAFLEVYLDFAAHHSGDRDAVLAERENLQTALAQALVAGAPETNLVRALDAAFRGSVDRVVLYDTVLALVHRNPQQIIYRQQQVYALAGVGRLDDAARAHEQLLEHLDEFARTEPAAAAAARPAILHSGALLALERGDRAAAHKLLQRALGGAGVDGPEGDTATHFELGRIALDEGQPRTARQHLEAAEPGMRRPPDRHVRVLLTLARAERADGDPDAAAQHLEQARLEVPTLDVLIEIIRMSIDSGRLDPAVVVLSEAGALVRDTGGLARLSLVSGALAAARKDDETATVGYERAAALAEQIRDTATAIEAYRRHADLVATSDPARADVLRSRADILAS